MTKRATLSCLWRFFLCINNRLGKKTIKQHDHNSPSLTPQVIATSSHAELVAVVAGEECRVVSVTTMKVTKTCPGEKEHKMFF